MILASKPIGHMVLAENGGFMAAVLAVIDAICFFSQRKKKVVTRQQQALSLRNAMRSKTPDIIPIANSIHIAMFGSAAYDH
jgi:hypothetical protein